jgi:RNA polymerase primary sigma factor
MKDIRASMPLTREKEKRLAALARRGDRKALNALVQSNLKFVVKVCLDYQNRGMPLTDLINEGNLGLIHAAKRFDETLGFKFISYAVWWIRQAILTALADQSQVINIPLSRIGIIHKLGKTTVKLEQKLGRAPTLGELAEDMGLGMQEIHECLQLATSPLSLDAPVKSSRSGPDGHDGRLEDVLEDHNVESPDKNTLAYSLGEKVNDILGSLEWREEMVMRQYFGIGLETTYTLEEIAHRLNLTRERVRQIKEKALARLRHPARRQKLVQFKA